MYRTLFLKNLWLTLFIVFFSCANSWAQNDNTTPDADNDNEAPEFVGSETKMYRYLDEHYPLFARREGIEGKVVIRFFIEANGQISDAEVLEAHYGKASLVFGKIKRVPLLEKFEPRLYRKMNHLTLELVESMPTWKPAKYKGKPIRSQYELPIMYEVTNANVPIIQLGPVGWFRGL